MKLIRSQLFASVVGGLVVAGTFLALGITGRRTTRTIVEQAPVAASPASQSSELTPHAIYVRDAPGVVFVKALVVQQVTDPFNLFPEREQSTSTGSGFLIDSRGYLLTNYHVIEGADRNTGVVVEFEDNIVRKAAVVAVEPGNDLALLRIDMTGLPPVMPLALGDSTTVRVGDPTLAIGNPFGLDRTLTSGIVSALQRQIEAPNGFSIDNVIQTDAPINPGNSGGPLIDATGRVIGINSQIETAGGDGNGSVGIAFAVPIDTAKEFLPRLDRGAVPARVAYLGANGVPAGAGVAVQNVDPGGPAADAGLRRGDVITAVAGERVSSMTATERIVGAQAPGHPMSVDLLRHRRPLRFTVRLGSRVAEPPR